MAVGIVNLLEVVEIKVHQADLFLGPALVDSLTNELINSMAVGKAGNGVRVRQYPQALLGPPLLGDIGARTDKVDLILTATAMNEAVAKQKQAWPFAGFDPTFHFIGPAVAKKTTHVLPRGGGFRRRHKKLKRGFADHVIELTASTATVAEAAQALGVQPGMIAKTMSFLQGDQAVLILTEGTAKVDNRKYKDTFHVKAKMIPFDEVEQYIGHAPGGVCPFGINEGVDVYLDESLRQFDTVYPAAGNDHSAVRLAVPELEKIAGAKGWIDVCKEPEKSE